MKLLGPAGLSWWSDLSLRAKGWIVVSIPLTVLLFGFTTSYLANREQDRASEWVQHTAAVRSEIYKFQDAFLDAYTGVRGYLYTRREEFLPSYRNLGTNLTASFTKLGHLFAENPAQTRELTRLQADAEEYVAALDTLAETSDADASADVLEKKHGQFAECQRRLDALHKGFGALDAGEARLETARGEALRRIEVWRTVVNIGGLVGGLLGAVLAMWLFSGGIGRQILHLRENADRLAKGQPLASAASSADEIGALARDLHRASGLLREREHALEVNIVQLQQARDEAEKANRAKSEFLSRMSHELRTPLNAILGFSQLLNMQETDEKKRECLEHITKGGAHLLELINEVLDIARIESGKLELSLEPVGVSDLLDLCLSLVRPLTEEKRIQLRPVENAGAGGSFVQADPQRIRQVLLNLLANAIKYNRDGGEVRVRCEPGERAGSLRVVVRDTGYGLSDEQQSQLFVPFERLGAEHTRIEGTGLGLALSRHLVDAMGGRLGVVSKVGEGSAFWIELPCAAEPAEEFDHDLAKGFWFPEACDPVDETNLPRVKVLYIEDNLSNLELVEQVLKYRPRVRLVSALDGSTGLRLAREQCPDLILLDLGLPDLSGQEVLCRLRKEAALREVPVVIMSTEATVEQIDRLTAAGAAAYLTKPFQVRELLRLVDELSLAPARS